MAERDIDEIENTYIVSLRMLVSYSAVCIHVPENKEWLLLVYS